MSCYGFWRENSFVIVDMHAKYIFKIYKFISPHKLSVNISFAASINGNLPTAVFCYQLFKN